MVVAARSGVIQTQDWDPGERGRKAEIACQIKRYPSALSIHPAKIAVARLQATTAASMMCRFRIHPAKTMAGSPSSDVAERCRYDRVSRVARFQPDRGDICHEPIPGLGHSFPGKGVGRCLEDLRECEGVIDVECATLDAALCRAQQSG
jgi:hypothetical protein